MKILTACLPLLAVLAVGALTGCSTGMTKSAEVTGSIRASLDQSGLKDVSVSQDRDKGVVTLTGNVTVEGDKAKAEAIARSFAGEQVVANEIAVVPVGAESAAKSVNSDLDKGIEHNLNAALVQEKLQADVKYSVKNHVVTLSGNVDSQAKRARAEQVAAGVTNVKQVVNELQVKGQKASSTD